MKNFKRAVEYFRKANKIAKGFEDYISGKKSLW